MTFSKDGILMLEGDRDTGFLDIACHMLFTLFQSMAFAMFVCIYQKKNKSFLRGMLGHAESKQLTSVYMQILIFCISLLLLKALLGPV